MKKDQYLPHDASALGNGKLMELIAEHGMEGYGIYWMLMEHLRQQDNYRSTLKRMTILARKMGVSMAKLAKILRDFELFIVENEVVSSPGLDERMQYLDQKRAKYQASGSKGGKAKALKDSCGNAGNAIAVKESKESKVSKESNTIIIRDDNPVRSAVVRSWEEWVDALAQEQVWCEYMAMRSGLGKSFMKQYPEIIAFFKRHIISYGKEGSIDSLSDAKNYFSNFIVPGKPPHQQLLEALNQSKAVDPYRYEDVSPSGERSYYGLPIPRNAPPRPNGNAHWDGDKWE